MKALSIRQPWAWLICRGFKDIENRNWKLPAYGFSPPGRVYVHAGKRMGISTSVLSVTEEWILERLTPSQREEYRIAPRYRGEITEKTFLCKSQVFNYTANSYFGCAHD